MEEASKHGGWWNYIRATSIKWRFYIKPSYTKFLLFLAALWAHIIYDMDDIISTKILFLFREYLLSCGAPKLKFRVFKQSNTFRINKIKE